MNARGNHGAILPLELRDVTFTIRGKPLIKQVNATIRPGRRTCVIGPNGAGKSLFLRLCHGLLHATAGTVRWIGPGASRSINHVGERQAMVFQHPVMLRRSARANVEYGLALRGVPRPERRRQADEVLGRTGLLRFADQPARTMSGGEQQRLAIARAWALEPEVLFLDEPTANLDPSATHAVEEIVQAIHAAGTAIVMTTHDLAQARRLGDDIIFMHRGRLLEAAPAERFFEAPQNDLAQAFLRGELLWWTAKKDEGPRRPPQYG